MPLSSTIEAMPRRLRILFVIGSMSGGGAERQVIEILRLIDRSLFVPLLYLSNRQGELLGSIPDDVPVFAYRDPGKESWWQRWTQRLKLAPLMRAIHLARVLRLQHIDAVYDRTYRATLDAAAGTLLRSTPRVSCCVVDPQPELELHARGCLGIAWRVARWAYRRADLVLVNSSDLRDRLINYFQLRSDRVVTCPNLLDLERIDQLATGPGPVLSDSFQIVTAGRLHSQKGHRYLIEAVNELVHTQKRDIHLTILGIGELEDKLKELVQSLNLEGHVTFAGYVANPFPWLRQAGLFVLPSLYEGSPNALLEAVASGIPVVSTDCPSGPRDILEGGRLGQLVPVANSAALAESIADAMDRYMRWKERASLAREVIRRRFDARVGIQQLEGLLAQVAMKQDCD